MALETSTETLHDSVIEKLLFKFRFTETHLESDSRTFPTFQLKCSGIHISIFVYLYFHWLL